ncbi:MAG: amidohydrolase, partial [Prevotellaceae bacterium]|nr:amidohydrolase [Prevotellaceae bacterium]
ERKEVVDQNEIDELTQTIDSLLILANELDFAQKENPFLNQENQLVDLQKKYPCIVFPFYAVDPRRKENYTFENGTYDLSPILNRLAINGGHFYGIKLYAPNGYSPADPMLMALYEYCEKHAIPIIAHCSGGGFASFAKTVNIQGLIYRDGKIEEHNGSITFKHYKVTDKERVHEKAQMLNHPLIWEKVLEKYPNLILDLAHFGNSEGSEEWSQHIIRLMKRYPNLYTDFSCVTGSATLDNMYETYYSKAESSVKSRFLYGSDFYLNMLFIDNMKHYIDQFEKIFSAADMKDIAETNPRRFLRI